MPISITGQLKVSTLQSRFLKEFGLTLRIYDGRSFADPDQTLAQVRKKKGSGNDLSVAKNMKVGNLEDKFEAEFGLKVQVAGSDDSYLCNNRFTLNQAKKEDEKKLERRNKKSGNVSTGREEKNEDAMSAKSGQYEFHVQLTTADEDFQHEEVVFDQKIVGDDIQDLIEIIRPHWDELQKGILEKSGQGDVEYSLYVNVEEIIRIADGISYFDDESIPQGPDVSDELLELLDDDD